MKTDTQTLNENASPNSRELEILKKYFPQCFSKKHHTDLESATPPLEEDVFDIEKFTEILKKGDIDIKKEGYALNFLGKSFAHYQANLDSETVIVPDEKNAETESENVYIVGDNLDALQHLKYSYAEKIKCIYIDPPYNTGKDDFVYNDKFGFTAKELEEKLDVNAEEAERIVSMNGKCTHSAWLTFMYPRLALARELLRDDGVIFISIDDNEQANLKLLCDEVFGEGNFVATINWKGRGGRQDSKYFAAVHEYILCYAKTIDNFVAGNDIKSGDVYPKYDENRRRYYKTQLLRKWGSNSKREDRPNLYYPIKDPDGNDFYPVVIQQDSQRPSNLQKFDGRWRWAPATMQQAIEEGRVEFSKNKNGDWIAYEKIFAPTEGEEKTKKFITWIDDIGNGAIDIKNLFEMTPFDYAKPLLLMQRFLAMANIDDDDIILDFFSGSGTTAHAVMDLNAKDGGKRKFIMVQLDESVKKGSEAEKAGFRAIDQIGRERIHRAAAKIKAENPGTTADLGFKTYYLKSMPKETLDKIKVFNPNELISSDGDIVKSLGAATVLQTWQIKDGFGFNAKPQKIDLAGYSAYLFDDEKIGKYLYLLEEIEEKAIKELVRKIEGFELAADKIFLYGYSFDFNTLNSITTNLKTLKNRNPIEPIVRY